MDTPDHLLQARLADVEQRIAAACQRAGRSRDDVQLVAVTKYTSLAHVADAIALGQLELGESRPQQLIQRAQVFPPSVSWHLIGHLQRNKVEQVLPWTRWIHSVDSLRLMQRIDEVAERLQRRPNVLLEVNLSGEQAKDGLSVDELRANWKQFAAFQQVNLGGLMTMVPLDATPSEIRGFFRQLRELRDELNQQKLLAVPMSHLSMGMSGDFEIAIEEGATMIRLGSTLFEGLDSPPDQDSPSGTEA